MPTASEEILARKAKYDQIERETDSLGRSIGVKRLKPSRQIEIQEMTTNLDGDTAVVDEATGAVLKIPKISPLIMAAAVCEIDGQPVPPARNRAELNSILDRLDNEGLAAVAVALGRLSMLSAGQKPIEEQAKN